MFNWLNIFRRRKNREDIHTFRIKIERFRALLEQNNRVLELIADAGEKLGGDFLFDTQYLVSLANQLEEASWKVVLNLNYINDNRYFPLVDAFERAKKNAYNALSLKSIIPDSPSILPLENIDGTLSMAVGEKMARLGEIHNRLGYKVPDGFVITSKVCKLYFDEINLFGKISSILDSTENEKVDPNDMERELSGLIMNSELQKERKKLIQRFANSMLKKAEGRSLFAVRSSSIGEDGDLSYAGLHETYLGIPVSDIPDAYKRVLASLFTSRAVSYRYSRGEALNEALMAVGCLRMINTKSSGVAYTMDPNNPQNDILIVTAALGLGKKVVEGSGDADRFIISRNPPYGVISRKLADKKHMYDIDTSGNLQQKPVPHNQQQVQTVSEEFLAKLAVSALRIEQYMKCAQDIEWAMDKNGELVILQARPLKIFADTEKINRQVSEALKNHRVLISNRGIVASRGIGYGHVVITSEKEKLKNLPENYVLVARTSSPHLAELVPKANAVIPFLC